MTRLSHEDLARRSLARQFPAGGGLGAADVLALLDHLGPIQSQVPRAPFLAVASRRPGVGYATVQGLFEEHRLLKTSSLRGTVHTTGRQQYVWTDVVARRGRVGPLTNQLGLTAVSADALLAEVEAFADDVWRPRAEIVAHAEAWLGAQDPGARAGRVRETYLANLLWGHSGLLRRPPDDRWEKRTDIHHRRARAVVPALGHVPFADALAALVRVHLGAAGPLTRHDLAYFLGVGLGQVDAAVAALGEEVVPHEGPDAEVQLDLAEPPAADPGELGVRLLPEFDALLVAYHGRNRTRFLDADQLSAVWAPANGQFAPTVLHQGRIVATWRTLTRGARVDVEVTMLPARRPLADDLLVPAVAALGAVLDVGVADVRVRTAPDGA